MRQRKKHGELGEKTLVIICDTREQKVLDYSNIDGVEKIEMIALPFGDYTALVNNKPVPIVFERKNLQDLFSTLTSDHARFKREMERARQASTSLILLVEGTYTDVWNFTPRGNFDGESMIKLLATMLVKYDLHTWFCESRRVMARRIVDTFAAVERNYKKEDSHVTQRSDT